MGVYLNPSSKLFENTINSEIYVDKSGLLNFTNSRINTTGNCICVSRPRRFGKTTGLNMLAAYYGCKNDAKRIFNGLKVNGEGEYANQFNVIKLNAVTFFQNADTIEEALNTLSQQVMHDMKREYSEIDFSVCKTLIDYCNEIYYVTKKAFVILIDEWDGVFRELQSDKTGQRTYLDFLRNWLKDQEYVALAYMTGILPIKKYGQHSALNMFREYSMEDPDVLAEFVGFTADEVKALCERYDMDFAQCKEWYDGYYFPNVGEIYSPLSVVEAMMRHRYSSYWNKTETYEALQMYIKMNFDGLKDVIIRLIAGDTYKINTKKFTNDMVTFNSIDDVLTLLIHLGYLAYDIEKCEVFIPNKEVRMEYYNCIEDDESMNTVVQAIKKSDELLEETLKGNAKKVAELIEKAHFETSHLQYNDENALAYTISLAYYTARNKYTIVREMPTGKGYADMIFLPRPHHPEMPPMIVEMKWNRSAKAAISQIRNKKYMDSLKDYAGNILLVGINYNRTTRKHTCRIEKG